MANISASVPDQLKAWIESQIEAGFYTSTSDYLRDLIRNDQAHKQQLDQLLLEGLHSGEAIKPDENYWKAKKAQLQK
jgi:antitoxin ParD1/3/4